MGTINSIVKIFINSTEEMNINDTDNIDNMDTDSMEKIIAAKSSKDYPEGNFNWIADKDTRIMVSHMYNAAKQLELLDWFKNEKPSSGGYMCWSHPNLTKIINHELVKNDGHSGSTESFTLRYIQMIVTKGWDKIVQETIDHYNTEEINNTEDKDIYKDIYKDKDIYEDKDKDIYKDEDSIEKIIAAKSSEDYPEGNFNWISGESTRIMVSHMYNAAKQLELLDWLKNVKPPKREEGGYTCWNHPNIQKIINHELLKDDGHSLFTETFTVKYIHWIAIEGWNKVVQETINKYRIRHEITYHN